MKAVRKTGLLIIYGVHFAALKINMFKKKRFVQDVLTENLVVDVEKSHVFVLIDGNEFVITVNKER